MKPSDGTESADRKVQRVVSHNCTSVVVDESIGRSHCGGVISAAIALSLTRCRYHACIAPTKDNQTKRASPKKPLEGLCTDPVAPNYFSNVQEIRFWLSIGWTNVYDWPDRTFSCKSPVMVQYYGGGSHPSSLPCSRRFRRGAVKHLSVFVPGCHPG